MKGTSASQVLEAYGFKPRKTHKHGEEAEGPQFYVDMPVAKYIEEAVEKGEGKLAANGSLAVLTGKYTGRSPHDRFVVDTPDIHESIAWGKVNRPIDKDKYLAIRKRVVEYLDDRDVYVVRGFAGADRNHSRKFLVACECAHQAMFIKQMLVRPLEREMANFGVPDFVVVSAPGLKLDPEEYGINSEAAILVNFEDRTIVICGTGYSGEIKKSIFSVMNFLMPTEDYALPMHCSCSMDPITHETAVFFGLSGTGKTTLSANPTRLLIGDDEHVWTDMGVFNIEGGCYAKCEGLDAYHEPEIYNAIKFGSLSENVVLDARRNPDYNDTSVTRNTRAAYPVEHIPNAWTKGMGTVPSVVMFLTCDAFGVLPPISRLSPEAAMYHFVTGFTAKIPGTEVGVTEPTPTFSSLFGEPFMPLDPMVYADLLCKRIAESDCRVYLVNTGWIGGGYGVGRRIDLAYTRALVARALDGTLEESDFVHDDIFNVDIPTSCHGVPDGIMVPRQHWQSAARYDEAAYNLAAMFEKNFEEKFSHLPDEVRAAGPHTPENTPRQRVKAIKEQLQARRP